MSKLSRIILFLLINVMGFMSVPVCYYVGKFTSMLSTTHPEFDVNEFKMYFVTGTYLTWFVCALFSFAYFFLRGKERLLFLWAPLVIPMVYGLSVILSRFSI